MQQAIEIRMTPEQMMARLHAAEVVEVNCHRVFYDKRDGVVWYTNPYGIDGILCMEPKIEVMRRFLDDMRQDRDYGPLPC